jgi:hypothetical protein
LVAEMLKLFRGSSVTDLSPGISAKNE